MPFVKFNAEEEIAKQCARDPEFKRVHEENEKMRNEIKNSTFTHSEKFLNYVRTEITNILTFYLEDAEENKITNIADDILSEIDWNNEALMHKGLMWIVMRHLENTDRRDAC